MSPSESDPWWGTARRLLDPRIIMVLAAAVLELVALCLWPTVYLLDSTDVPSRLGTMLLQRFPLVAAVHPALKLAVDAVFPGALWSWEELVAFFFHCLLAAFVAYAVVAWRLVGAGM